jgi:putative acetyltransferase
MLAKNMVEVFNAVDPTDIEIARQLFREYNAELGIDLGFQDFTTEVATLPGAYALPHGRLLLARGGAELVGCVALRSLPHRTCEMKRLYVRARNRASGAGRQLVEQVIKEARIVGYKQMFLDTLPNMTRAQTLYAQFGFKDVPPYRHNPIKGTRFLRLDL